MFFSFNVERYGNLPSFLLATPKGILKDSDSAQLFQTEKQPCICPCVLVLLFKNCENCRKSFSLNNHSQNFQQDTVSQWDSKRLNLHIHR